ncbi:hypothetical protein AGMMS50233_02580 [Endomicrobiia bacterium]|nr:hypothetical protein AGMMS50233_02580 [Endomicrobiia bacterium]
MKEIGRILREKHEQINVSLADARNAIKVQEECLSAIGEVDMSVFLRKSIIRVL